MIDRLAVLFPANPPRYTYRMPISLRPPTVKAFMAIATFLLTWTLLSGGTALACSTPVFRYAIERWPADDLELVLLHDGPLSDTDRQLVDRLHAAADGDDSLINLAVRPLSIQDAADAETEALVRQFIDRPMPAMVLRYPLNGARQGVAWSGALNETHVNALLDSPARQEVARRLLAGDSAVWVVIDSGNESRDSAAAAQLDATLGKLATRLDIELLEDVPTAGNLAKAPPLDVRYSVLRIHRDDPRELVFREMLIASEDDLYEYADQPIAFPIFGRGRVLYSLVGRGITETNIGQACAFLSGPCSCEVKAENPGADLLMAADWEAFTRNIPVEPVAAPSLMGLTATPPTADQTADHNGAASNHRADTTPSHTTDLMLASDSTPTPAASGSQLAQGDAGSALPLWILISVGGVLILACTTVVILRRSDA